jgi:hypothetical protein
MRLLRMLAAVYILLLGACDSVQDQEMANPAGSVFADPSRRLASIGTAGGDTSSALGIVLSARITSSGDHIVVLDAVPPFIKVFERSGRLRSAFLRQGGGPSESVGPASLAVSGDSVVLVTDVGGGVSTFDFDGHPMHRIPSLGLVALAATEACGAWLLYGPRFSAGSAGEALWLHRLLIDAADASALESFVSDSLASSGLGIGKPYGFVATSGGAVARHDLGSTPSLINWSCDTGTAQVTPLPAAAIGRRPPPLTRTEEGLVARLEPGIASPVGLAALKGGHLLANRETARDQSVRTVLYLIRGGETVRAEVPGDYALRDARPGEGVLIGTPDPMPQLFLLEESAVEDLFRVSP